MRVRIFVEPQEGASYETLVETAKVAEECGFDAFFRSDHYLAMNGDGMPGPTDAWTSLAGIARETSRIRLGTLVTPVTFRLPGILAIQVAGVDAMSGGRVELGLGAGWFDTEHAAYGIPFPPNKTRFEMLEEQLTVIRGMFEMPVGERFTFSGSHYELADCPALPKPVQERLPIVMGGAGPKKTPRLAARFADEFNVPFHSVADTSRQFGLVREACEAIGRESMRFSAAQVVCCGANEGDVERRAKAIGREPGELRVNGAAGMPGEVVERLAEFAEIGAESVYLQVLDLGDPDHLGLIASEVMGAL